MLLARWRGNGLLFQIDADASRPLAEFDFGGETIDNLLIDHNRENAVLKTIGEENIAKSRPDNGADSHFLQRPHRTLARRTATEIRPGNEDLSAPVGFAVEDEIRVFRSVRQITQRAKSPFSERPANRGADQTLNADDHVSIDVAPHDRSGYRAQLGKGFRHLTAPLSAHRRSRPISPQRQPSPGLRDGSGHVALACR